MRPVSSPARCALYARDLTKLNLYASGPAHEDNRAIVVWGSSLAQGSSRVACLAVWLAGYLSGRAIPVFAGRGQSEITYGGNLWPAHVCGCGLVFIGR